MKILLVEDDDSLATGITYALGKEEWEIDSVINKEQALKKIDSHSYDFFLLDIMLPDGNGFEICEYIRKEKDSPIIFLTARDEEVNIIKGLDMGADDYITKPFTIGELTSRIKAIYRRIDHRKSNLLDFGDLKININKQEVKINGKRIRLTPSE